MRDELVLALPDDLVRKIVARACVRLKAAQTIIRRVRGFMDYWYHQAFWQWRAHRLHLDDE
jgi:hypothetical protein